MDPTHAKLIRGSRRLAFAFTALFWTGALWLFSEAAWRPLKGVVASSGGGLAGAAWARLFDALLAEAPAFALMGALWTARGLFHRFALGDALTPASGRSLSLIGLWFLASALVSSLVPSRSVPESGVFIAPPGVSMEIVLGCVGAALVLLGRAFAAAAAIKADHDQIV